MKKNFTLNVFDGCIEKSIIFHFNDDFLTFKSKIISNFDLYRKPYPHEIIERKSSNETLEDLLKRGIKEENVDFIYNGGMMIITSHDYSNFIESYKKKNLFLFWF